MWAKLPDFPMPITTPRLLIRPPQIGDSVVVNEAILESFDMLHRFMEWAKDKPSLAETKEFIKLSMANWLQMKNEDIGLQLFIFERETNQFIGVTSFYNFSFEVPSVETGYWIRTSRAKQGLATEAMNAITQYAFKQLGVKRISISCDTDNTNSKKIPERLGYLLEATLKAHRRKPLTNEISDTLIYARYNLLSLPDLSVQWVK